MPSTLPRLLADIGGTNARFALESAGGELTHVRVLPCAAYASLSDALRAYLDAAVPAGARPDLAALAIANPVGGDQVAMTNHHWQFSIEAVRREFGFAQLLVANDFKALAMALPLLSAQQRRQIGGGAARAGVLGLLGPGTGLGVSALIPGEGGWRALDSEGGHVTFAPADERELAILRFAWRHHPHVSAERLLSGIGLALVYRALAERAGVAAAPRDVPQIIAAAVDGSCPVCVETIDCFCAMLGTVAGNLAVTLGAAGGVYIGGGIVPRLGALFERSAFRRRFEQKGRFSAYLAQIPTWLITAEFPGLIGVGAMLRSAAPAAAARRA
ncbi:MAG: glucokinase [Pseudomonadota bacterium]|nr:glucokinase [Pseudomonadota bacterium]